MSAPRLTAAALRDWPAWSFGTSGWPLDREIMGDAIAHAGPGYFVLHPEQWPEGWPSDPAVVLDPEIEQINAGADWHGRYVGERETVAIVTGTLDSIRFRKRHRPWPG